MTAVHGLPDLIVEVDGDALTAVAARALSSVTVSERLSTPARCELVFEEPDRSFARDAIAPGSGLRIKIAGEDHALFAGKVTGLEFGFGPDRRRRVAVRAHDPLQQLRRRQVVRAHVESSLESLAREMGNDVGLSLTCHGSTPSWGYLVNERGSDFDFLVELASRAGLYLAVRDETLHLCSLEGFGDPVELELEEDLLEARFDVGSEPPCRGVSVIGWDAAAGRATRGEATQARSPARADDWFDAGDGTSWTITDAPAQSDDAAQLYAQAVTDARAAGQMVLRGVAVGQTTLRPGARVQLRGAPTTLDDDFVLTSVVHTCNADTGFQSELSTAPPRVQAERTASRLTLGVVTRVDDPDGRGRVKANLPSYGEVESDWMHVVCPGAGARKGLTAHPDVSDPVLVALTHEDPARGLVLGGLFGAAGSADAGVTGNAVKRYGLVTAGGNSLRFDDEHGSLRFQNADGSYLEMSPEQIHLFAKRDLVLEAPGHAIVIRGDTIDFRRG